MLELTAHRLSADALIESGLRVALATLAGQTSRISGSGSDDDQSLIQLVLRARVRGALGCQLGCQRINLALQGSDDACRISGRIVDYG